MHVWSTKMADSLSSPTFSLRGCLSVLTPALALLRADLTGLLRAGSKLRAAFRVSKLLLKAFRCGCMVDLQRCPVASAKELKRFGTDV